jgi:hypothetical protein
VAAAIKCLLASGGRLPGSLYRVLLICQVII